MKSKGARSLKTPTRTVGRPRALTLDEILDAAIAMGLTGLSMPALAAKLGIGTATLYNYVANRDELLRAAAIKQTRKPALDDLGQDWRTLIRTHAMRFFEFWSSEPQLLIQHMQGAMGPEVLVDYVESFLTALQRRGFTVENAYRIYSATNTVVMGTVVRACYLKAMRAKGPGHGAIVRRCLQERPADELPNLRTCSDFADDDRLYDFEATLEHVLDGFAAEFGDGASPKEPKKPKRTAKQNGRAGRSPRG
jgi:AcrR family transcriptional regulator